MKYNQLFVNTQGKKEEEFQLSSAERSFLKSPHVEYGHIVLANMNLFKKKSACFKREIWGIIV